MKVRRWLIRKLIGSMPVIANIYMDHVDVTVSRGMVIGNVLDLSGHKTAPEPFGILVRGTDR